MGWMIAVPVNFMEHSGISANVVRDIFCVGDTAGAGRQIQTGYFYTDPVPCLKGVAHRHNLYQIGRAHV